MSGELVPQQATTLNDLLALLPDNATGEITPADMRQIVTDLWDASHPPFGEVVAQGPFNLVANAAWTPLPAPGVPQSSITLADPGQVKFTVSCNLDTLGNNNQVQLALGLTGATVVPPGTHPEQVLWVGGKQALQATVEVTFMLALLAGVTDVDVFYTAQGAATVTAFSAMANLVGWT
jgi:hypothetical protein